MSELETLTGAIALAVVAPGASVLSWVGVEGIGVSMTGAHVESVFAKASSAKRRLSLEEVLEAGLPAVYQQFGEQLLYMNDRIFDASDPGSLAEILLIVAGEAERAVGVEFGWRHAGDCSCSFCSKRPAAAA